MEAAYEVKEQLPYRRESVLERLRTEHFDLLVVGGGINGAGTARDAAMNGLRVALVEKGDFASGTSSKSSKLIHGGIRYLQQGDLRLVRVACRERDLLRRRLAPHLVQPLPFVFPVYSGDPVGLFTLGAGMWIYDLLAVFRNIRAHRMLGRTRTLALEPGLRSEGLRGAALYYDCITDDARLTLETVLSAEQEGAVIANYVELKGFIKENGRIVGASLQDRSGEQPFVVRAQCVVNNTGPWADHVRRLDEPTAEPCLRLTKGAHIVVPRSRVGNIHAVVMHSPQDQRVLFAIPWQSHSIIGTTDTDYTGSPDAVAADEADLGYLLNAANWFFPGAHLTTADIISAYAGLRPLVTSPTAKGPSAVSREEEIFESASGLITLAGGKLTTYRFVAEEVVKRVVRQIQSAPKRKRPSATSTKPLVGACAQDLKRMAHDLAKADGHGLSEEQLEHLVARYGSRTPDVLSLLKDDGELKQSLVPGLPDIWAEAEFAATTEMAVEPEDILLRRTHVALKDPRQASQITEKLSERLTFFRDKPR